MRWWAIAKGPGINIGESSLLSTLKSAAKLCPFTTPLHMCSTFAAAVLCAFLYSANVNAFFTSSLPCHLASEEMRSQNIYFAKSRTEIIVQFIILAWTCKTEGHEHIIWATNMKIEMSRCSFIETCSTDILMILHQILTDIFNTSQKIGKDYNKKKRVRAYTWSNICKM